MRALRLQYRLALAAFLPLLVFGLVGIGVGIYALVRIPEQLAIERQIVLAQVAAAGVAGNLQTHVATLQLTAADVGSSVENPRRVSEILSTRYRALSAFTIVTVLNAQGDAIATLPYDAPARGRNYASEGFFDQATKSNMPTFSAVSRFEPNRRPAAIIAVPLSSDDRFAGVIVGAFALDRPYWARSLNLLNTPQGGLAYLVDQHGAVVYHPDGQHIGSSLDSEPALHQLVLAGHAKGLMYTPPAGMAPKVIAFAPVQGVGWGLVAEEPWEAVSASVAPYQYAAAGLMVLGFLLALVALVWTVRRETKPLASLAAEGERVARGERFRAIAVEGSPDVRALITVVNEAMDALVKQQEALRRYALDVMRGQENERLRISRDLHDGTVQDLVGLTQRIELCADSLGDGSPAARERLDEVERLARRALVEVRRISHSLRPAILEDVGLVASLQALTNELAQDLPGARVHFEIVGIEAQAPAEAQLTIFRIAQEALANVRKHARSATRVSVALIFEVWGITLQVEDDGPGFMVANRESLVNSGHLGLAGMSERAQLLGGTLSVESSPGNGTTISLHMPLRGEMVENSLMPPEDIGKYIGADHVDH